MKENSVENTKNTESVGDKQPPMQSSNQHETAPTFQQQGGTPQPTGKHSKKWVLIAIVVLLLICGGVAAYCWYAHRPSSSNNTSSTKSTTTNTAPSVSNVLTPFLTYVSQNTPKSLMITDTAHKTLETLTLPSDKNTFTVLANNGQSLLVKESYITGGPDANSMYYLVNSNGQSTKLPANVTSILSGVTSDVFLMGSDNLSYVDCNSTACTLNVLNLSTAAKTAVYSTPFTPPTSAGEPSNSMNLIGVSPAHIAYAVVYPANGQGVGTLMEFNLDSKAHVKTLPMAYPCLNPPKLAYDFQTLVYANGAETNQGTAELMDLGTGKTTPVTSDISGNTGVTYIWSPDSTKIAIVANPVTDAGNQHAANTPLTLAYIDVANARTVTLKSFGDSRFNTINIDGWSSATRLNYDYAQTKVPNSFTSGPQLYAIDVGSYVVTPNPTPAGYQMVLVGSN